MLSNSPAPTSQRFFVILGGAVLVTASLYAAKEILMPLVLAVLFSFMLNPLVGWVQKCRLGRVVSVLLVTGCAFSFLAVLGWIFTQQLAEVAHELPRHKETIVHKITELQGAEDGILGSTYAFVEDIGAALRKEETHRSVDDAPPAVKLVTNDPPATRLGWVTDFVGPLRDTLIGTVLIVVLAVLILINRENMRNRIIRLAGHSRLISTTKVLDDVAHRISSFLFMQAAVNFCFGLVLGIGLFLFGFPYAPLFGLLAGSLRFVPYVGSSITGALLFVCTFAFFPSWTECLTTLGLFVFLEILAAYAVEPLLFGRKTGISPVALLMAAAFWTWLWGPIGLILSTPLTVCLIVLGKNVPSLTFLNVLLGDEPVLAASLRYYQRLVARDQDEAIDVLEGYLQGHDVDSVHDDIFVPALVLAKRDVTLGELSEERETAIHAVMRETLEEYVAMESPKEEDSHADRAEDSGAVVMACAAHDEADDLAVEMLRSLLESRGQQLIVSPSNTLAGEILAHVETERPSIVIIAALPSGGLARTYYLCKRLRARLPKLEIIVGRWGLTEQIEQARERALAAGATELHTTLLETANEVKAPHAAEVAAPIPQAALTA